MQQVKQSSELIYAKYVVAYTYYVCMNEIIFEKILQEKNELIPIFTLQLTP